MRKRRRSSSRPRAKARAEIDARYAALLIPPFNAGSQWAVPASQDVVEGIGTAFADPNVYPVTDRGVTYAMGYFSAKRLGTGQYYLMSINDRAGHPLDGRKTYRLTIPPHAPVQQYWSATAYDRKTHALIQEMSRSSRASNSPDLKTNADGSVAIYFGPTAPAGQGSNWLPTNGRDFEVLFRLYGPKKAFFNKTWKLPDLEEVASQAQSSDVIRVTPDNFIRAESDLYFGARSRATGTGKLFHFREVMAVDQQTVIRGNRDTLYSSGVFDLDAGPVTVTLPDSGKRFMSMMVIDEDHYALETVYAPGTFTVSKGDVETRYILARHSHPG